MKIGNIDLGERPVLLAPMEDVTDASFRYVCKEYGADMMYTEFISSDGLIRDAAKTIAKMQVTDFERPIGIQIYGHIPDAMVEAAVRAEEAHPDLIDINFGCPVNKIARRERRSELMADGFRHADLMRWALGKNLDTATNPDGYVGVSKAVVVEYVALYNIGREKPVDVATVLANNYFTKDGYKSQYNTPACGGNINRVWNDKYYLEPIPSAQITLDPNLTQNPGW